MDATLKHCLVIDDASIIRKVARHIIETFGYRVSEAESAEEGLDRLLADTPDMVLLDWQLPGMTAVEFLGALRGIPLPRIPYIVYCTTEHDVSDLSKAFTAGADDYLLKPFNREVLEAKFSEIAMAQNETLGRSPRLS